MYFLKYTLFNKYAGLKRRLQRIKRKYFHKPNYTIAVYAIMYNEAKILREWVEIHLKEGVQHFFLLDHGSTDNWESTVSDYIDKKIITVKNLPRNEGGLDNLRADNVEFALAESEWLLIQDLDEFTYAPGEKCFLDFLNGLSADVHQVVVPWVLFGTAGNIKHPASIVKTCLKSEDMSIRSVLSNAERPWHAKSIVRSRYVNSIDVHIHNVSGKTVLPLSELTEVKGNFFIDNKYADKFSEFILVQNHYIHQSLEFYEEKMNRRNYAKESKGQGRSYTMDRFYKEEAILNKVDNFSLLNKYYS